MLLGCSSNGASPATIYLCGEVTAQYTCRERVQPNDVVAGVPYEFVAHGPPFADPRIEVVLVRTDAGKESVIARLEDTVAENANTYANNFSVREPGIYRLDVMSGGRVHATLTTRARRWTGGTVTAPPATP